MTQDIKLIFIFTPICLALIFSILVVTGSLDKIFYKRLPYARLFGCHSKVVGTYRKSFIYFLILYFFTHFCVFSFTVLSFFLYFTFSVVLTYIIFNPWFLFVLFISWWISTVFYNYVLFEPSINCKVKNFLEYIDNQDRFYKILLYVGYFYFLFCVNGLILIVLCGGTCADRDFS